MTVRLMWCGVSGWLIDEVLRLLDEMIEDGGGRDR